jgi:hypothetical protein
VRWICRELGAAGRQRHWLPLVRIQCRREMAGVAQRDHAGHDAGRRHSGSCHLGRARSVRRNPGRSAAARGGGDSGQCARPEGDRARHRCLRALAERGPDCDWERVSVRSSPFDREARGPAQTACGLCAAALRRSRRADLLWAQFLRSIPARSCLRRSYPQGREACGLTGAGTDQV